MKRILSFVVMLVMTLTVSAQSGTISNNGMTITEANGWLESAYIKFNLYSGAKTYNVYVKGGQYSDYTKIDEQLVRNYGSYGRADVVGLKAGTYAMKVVPVVDNKEVSGKYAEATGMTVKNYDRQGFAHKNWSGGVGAYNNDGTLKSGAKVLYITKNNFNTVSMDMVDGKNKISCVGIGEIFKAKQKGQNPTPIAVRIIGRITASDAAAAQRMSDQDGLLLKGNDASTEMGVTIEGIGDDAIFDGFGMGFVNGCDVEVRNMAIKDQGSSNDNMEIKGTEHIWVHNIDFFYGAKGSGDHAKGDGSLDCKDDCTYATFSYNHFWDTGKSNLCGMKSEHTSNLISYHHNWYDHCDSRCPRVRTSSVHVWNNFFDGVSKYGVGATSGSSIFVENNYFRDTNKPMLSSLQGTDAQGDGTFSGETGGIIKSYGNVFAEKSANFKYVTYQSNNTSFDAYEASSRTEKIGSSVKTLSGGTTYNNFDTSSDMYTYTPDAANDVPGIVQGYYGAGRLNHGDIAYDIPDTDDHAYVRISELDALLAAYKTSLVGIFGDENAESGEQGGEGGEGGESGGGEGGGEEGGGESPVPVETGTVMLQSDNVPAGYQIDGSSSVTAYSYSSDLCKDAKLIKEASGQHTITLPANAKVTKIVMYAVGDNNSADKGAITELAGKTFNVSLPSRKTGTAFATATVDNVELTGSITFTVTYGAGVKFQLTVEQKETTGITDITVGKTADGVIYDLMGRRVTELRPGQLYIQNGKKFIKR